MTLSRSRMWVRRSFVLALLIVFLASFCGILYLHLCFDVWAAGLTALVPTAIIAYWGWRVGSVIKNSRGITAGYRN